MDLPVACLKMFGKEKKCNKHKMKYKANFTTVEYASN